MPIICVGISHRRTPVELLERLTFSEHDLQQTYEHGLPAVCGEAGCAEFAIVSTCNRTEIYASTSDRAGRTDGASDELLAAICAVRDVPVELLAGHAYHFVGTDAVRHLCRVASGLESMMLGESEVLGQVLAAHQASTEEGAAGPVLEAVFQAAIRSGRRARSETGIGRNPLSVGTEAVRLAREVAGDLAERRVLIVGTGKMGRLTAESVRAAGVGRLAIVSRTTKHAETLAEKVGARARPWHELVDAIREADVVLSSTSAPHAVLTAELVHAALGDGGRPVVFVDVAVPRDVEPAVGKVPGVRVYDIDALQARVARNLAERQREVPAVERIVEEEVDKFEEWRRGAALRPLFAAMRARGDAIRQRELDRLFRRMGDVPEELREDIARFSESLVSKLLHEPTQRLRAVTDPERCGAYAQVTRDLFGLDEERIAVTGVDAA
jgi:glutamyl-tRNA reductase